MHEANKERRKNKKTKLKNGGGDGKIPPVKVGIQKLVEALNLCG